MVAPNTSLVTAGAVTQLRFVGASNASGVDASRRRHLSLRDGWQLAGNLHTLGYFSGALNQALLMCSCLAALTAV